MREPSSKIVRHSLLLLVAAQVANVANLLFHMVTGRLLSVEEYGLLVFMFNLIMIVSTPLDAMRSAMAHFTAALDRQGRGGDVLRLARRWVRELAAMAALLLVAGSLWAGSFAEFFNLGSPTPMVVVVGVIALSLFLPIVVGILQGVQAFVWMSVAGSLWCVVRLIVGVVALQFIGREAVVAMGGFGLGLVVSALVGAWVVRQRMRTRPSTAEPIEGPRRYVALTMVVFVGFALMSNLDVVLAKRYFPHEAGLVAMAGTIARTVIYLPMPIATALFPKVASLGSSTAEDRRVLGRALLLALGLIVAAAAVCQWWPQFPLWILYGVRDAEPELLNLVRVFVGALCPMPLVFMLANFEMAQRRFAMPLLLLPIAGAFVVAVGLLPKSPHMLAGLLCVATSAALLVLLLGLPRAAPIRGAATDAPPRGRDNP